MSIGFDTAIALSALFVSLIALGLSLHFWRRSFRPIVTAMVKTRAAGNEAILYDLLLLNSGTIPARNVRIRPLDAAMLASSLGSGANEERKRVWLACFDEATVVPVLHNNDRTACSFGTTMENDRGFWKYDACFPVCISYAGWFGKKYETQQSLHIVDSDSFTSHVWGDNSQRTVFPRAHMQHRRDMMAKT